MNPFCKGFSIAEYLIALVISTILLLEITSSYINQKKSFGYTYHLSLMAENISVIQQMLANEIHMAGFIGCGRLGEVILNSPADIFLTTQTKLFGFHNNKTSLPPPYPALLNSILRHAKPGTDVLIIQEADAKKMDAYATNNTIFLNEKSNFKAGELLIISNCNQGTIFKVQAISGDEIIPNVSFQRVYPENNKNQIGYFHTLVFYIADTGRKNLSGNQIFALYRRDLNASINTPSEWIEGVDNLQISYGVLQLNSNTMQYFTADLVPNWEKVKIIHLSFLLDSLDAIFENPHKYNFQNKSLLATDRRLYHQWNLDYAIRE